MTYLKLMCVIYVKIVSRIFSLMCRQGVILRPDYPFIQTKKVQIKLFIDL